MLKKIMSFFLVNLIKKCTKKITEIKTVKKKLLYEK